MAPRVMAIWTAVLLVAAAEAGSTSMEAAMHTASSNARIRFFMAYLLLLIIPQGVDGVELGGTLGRQVAEQHADAR